MSIFIYLCCLIVLALFWFVLILIYEKVKQLITLVKKLRQEVDYLTKRLKSYENNVYWSINEINTLKGDSHDKKEC